jgi:hypothetical protein
MTLAPAALVVVLNVAGAAAGPVAAEQDAPAPRAAVEADMLSYYAGEATSAYVILGLSVAYIGAGIPLTIQSSNFERGLGVPLLSLGVLEGIGSVFYAFQVQAEIRHYSALLASDPDGFRKVELTHIEGTQSRFWIYRAVELGLTLVGVGFATYGFIANQDLYKGIGIGLVAIGLPFFIIDTINNGRAARYHDRLKHFDPTLAVQKDERGWRLAFGARF